MMNEGLEVIEARLLFSLDAEQIGIVIHPQSIVHALVEMKDGSVLAQMAQADMRVPIACALAWPERIVSGADTLDLPALSPLEFQNFDQRRFPCAGLAMQAMDMGQAAVIALNAANEVAVDAFPHRRLAFNDIATLVALTLEKARHEPVNDIDAVLHIHETSHTLARECLQSLASH